MKNLINEKNLILFLSFFLIIFVFTNYIQDNESRFKLVKDNIFIQLNNFEFKDNMNQILIAEETYNKIIYGGCEITGDMQDRHKVRWVKSYFLKNVYQLSNNLNNKLPYYINILLHSFLIFASLIFLDKTLNLKKKDIVFFLLYITFIFQNGLGEESYSIFEMFFSSMALFASKRKNILLFSITTSLAVLNRESGFILIIIWLIFNKNYKQILFISSITSLVFIFANFKIINCIIDPKFFIPLEPQVGQISLSDVNSIGLFSLTKILLINFIIPFGIIFNNFFRIRIKNYFYIVIIIVYFFTFLIALPLHHVAARLIILPLIVLSFYLENKK